MSETGRGSIQTNVVMLRGIPGSGKSGVAAERIYRASTRAGPATGRSRAEARQGTNPRRKDEGGEG